MRTIVLGCALSASLAPHLLAQINVPINQVPQQPQFQQIQPQVQQPQIIPAEQRSHDFGSVARAAKTEHRFAITNIYPQQMHIRAVRASCGCTTPIIETETIEPGQTGSILARFNTGTFTGQKQANLTVSIDRPYFQELQLNVRGYIRSDIVFNPGELNFGAVPEGEAKQVSVSLEYAGRSDWAVLEASSSEAFVKTRFEEVSRANGRVGYKIFADLDANAPAGLINSQIVLRTNDNRLTTVPLTLLGEVQSLLEVRPQVLALGDVKLGETRQERFLLRSQKPFQVLAVESDNKNMEIQFEPSNAPKNVQFITLTLRPGVAQVDGQQACTLSFKTDLDDLEVKTNVTYRVVTQSSPQSQVSQPSTNPSANPLAGVR